MGASLLAVGKAPTLAYTGGYKIIHGFENYFSLPVIVVCPWKFIVLFIFPVPDCTGGNSYSAKQPFGHF